MAEPEILRATAAAIRATGMLEDCHYPAPDQIQTRKKPVGVLYWAGEVDTIITPDMDGDLIDATFKLQLLIPRKGHTPAEFAVIDDILPRIRRLINQQRRVSDFLGGLAGHVDRLRVTRIRSTLGIEYAGHEHYGGELFLNCKFHDHEDELP
jgi:hypothetical protein